MDALVGTAWLAERLGTDGLVVLDATYVAVQPDPPRDEQAEYRNAHVPGARFLDLRDLSGGQPTSLPDAGRFGERLRALGVGNDDRVVLYDNSPHRTAARAWWLLRRFAPHLSAAILDGGLAKWRAEGRPLEAGTPSVAPPGDLTLRPDPARSCDKAALLEEVKRGGGQLVDARSAARFWGTEADPHGLPSGHIPGSTNLHYAGFFGPDGTWRDRSELRDIFVAAGIDPERPMVATCGSGITAAVPAFAMTLIGGSAAIYDGSWREWASDPATPKVVP